MPPVPSREPARILWALLAAVPPLAVIVLVARWAVDAPLIDQWSMVHDFQKFFDGTWGPLDWIRSHNGHRILVPRLILVPLGALTGWDVRWEMALGILCAFGSFALLWRWVARALGAAALREEPWLLSAVALLVFSLCQWENWLWGIQMHVFLAVLLALAAFELLGGPRMGWGRLSAAAVCALLATFTQGTGLVVWPVGLVLLALRAGEPRARRAAQLVLWAVFAALVFALYLHRFPGDVVNAPSLSGWLRQPFHYVYYVLTLLGAPLASFAGSAWPPRDFGVGCAAGLGGLTLLAVTSWLLWRRAALPARLLPLLGGVLFSGAVAVQIGLGRVTLGVASAMASRYMTLTVPFWIAVLVGTTLAARQLATGRSDRRVARVLRGALAVVVGLALVSSYDALEVFPARHALLAPARAEMARGELDVYLQRLHGEVQQVRGGLGVLRRHRLSVFRDGELPPLPAAAPEPLRSFGQILAPLDALERFDAGATRSVRIAVTNPSDATWPALGGDAGAYSVRFSYHWFDAARTPVVFDGRRTLLPRDLGPGETVTLEATIEAPATPGRYLLRLSMVQEGVAWFDAAGAQPLDVEVVVGR